MNCTSCPLAKTRKNIVWGEGPDNPVVFLIGEAPGADEDSAGRPFIGKAGKELDNYLWQFAGVKRSECYVTNLVKCRPPRNRDPKSEEIEICSKRLEKELYRLKPRIIVTLGRNSLLWFYPYSELRVVHGIPRYNYSHIDTYFGSPILFPAYHPAAGLHDTNMMIFIQHDFEALGKLIRGEISPEDWKDEYPQPKYHKIDNIALSGEIPQAVDTEIRSDGSFFSVQTSQYPGEAIFSKKIDTRAGSPTIYVHNAIFDLPVLDSINFTYDIVKDTMVMAYLLQDEPQGLKALAYRHCGMEMMSYEEVTREATRQKALDYLRKVIEVQWPDPEPLLVYDKGQPKVKRPQNIGKKVKRIIKDSESSGADPWDRWHHIGVSEGRGIVEEKLGIMLPADLSDIPLERAVYYACRDADATCRVYPKLWKRIWEYGLEEVFWLDMAIIPMVIDMMKYGMLVDENKFERLSVDFGRHMDEIEMEIWKMVGHYVNPGSSQQVSKLLFKELGLRYRKKTATGQPSTNQKYLEAMRSEHEVVGKILDWRMYEQLKTTYTDTIPRLVDSDSRVHPQIKITRTATGRLASAHPNLQNQPVRTEEGRKIRECYVASEGCSLVSFDYNQIELRSLAHCSQDPAMLDTYSNGGDIHNTTGSRIFHLDSEKLDPYRHRIPSKTTNFSIPYGVTARGLREQLLKNGLDSTEWTLEKCEEFIGDWFSAFPMVEQYMSDKVVEAYLNGYVRDIFGRIRRIPELKSVHKEIISAGERQAGNMPIQSLAAGIIKKAMAELIPYYREFIGGGYVCYPLIQVHDDLVFEVSDEILHNVIPLFKYIMENCVELSVPVKVEVKVGKTWGGMSKWQ